MASNNGLGSCIKRCPYFLSLKENAANFQKTFQLFYLRGHLREYTMLPLILGLDLVKNDVPIF